MSLATYAHSSSTMIAQGATLLEVSVSSYAQMERMHGDDIGAEEQPISWRHSNA